MIRLESSLKFRGRKRVFCWGGSDEGIDLIAVTTGAFLTRDTAFILPSKNPLSHYGLMTPVPVLFAVNRKESGGFDGGYTKKYDKDSNTFCK